MRWPRNRIASRLQSWLARIGIFALILFLSLSAAQAAGNRVALVIGIDRYPNLSPNQQLQKAANDAKSVGDALNRLGFKVIRGTNLSRQGMIDKLAELTSQLRPGDIAAFFFAGHGIAIGGTNYLLPSDIPSATPDGEARIRGASIDEPYVVSEIQNVGVRVALLVLDACRDNPFPHTGTRSIGNTRGLAEAKPARGIFTIYSAGIGQTALDRLEPDDTNPNSVFTRVFLNEIVKPGLDLVELAVETREKVAELALTAKGDGRPEPHEQTPAYYDQTIGGRVFLSGRSKADERIGLPATPSKNQVAAQAWSVIQNTGSQAVLEDFIRQFGDTPFGSMARARLNELRAASVKSETARIENPPSVSAHFPAPEHVVLYEEDPNNADGKRFVGSAIWRIERVSSGPGQSSDIGVRANVEIPGRGMTVSWSLRRNNDKTLPASHTVEVKFTLPPDFSHRGIQSLAGLLMKESEQARGTPLAGLSVKVTTNYFLMGLSATETDRERNIALLKERSWFDIPVVYSDGHRAIIAVEKGPSGERAFAQAFANWDDTRSAGRR